MKTLGLASAVILPFFNIPLIVRIIRRRSSQDISLVWAVGVWACIIGMLPASLSSADRIMVVYSIVNTILFTITVAVIFCFHPLARARSQRASRSISSTEP